MHREETIQQRDRRLEAIEAMHLIDHIARSQSAWRKQALWWDQLESTAELRTLRNEGGPRGDLARKIRWGTPEPLPGWRIAWVRGAEQPTFALTDVYDPCRFRLSSEDAKTMGRTAETRK